MHRVLIALSLTVVALHAQTPAEPEDLSKLRISWQRAVTDATAPLNKKYLDALTVMKQRYTKEGNLEAALKVDAEIKSLSAAPGPPAAPKEAVATPAPEGKRLSNSEKKILLSYFVGKTWEFTGEGKTEWFFFDDKGGGRRLVTDGTVNPKLHWELKPDGELLMWGAGYTKKTRFITADSATVVVVMDGGATVNTWTAKPSEKVIPEK